MFSEREYILAGYIKAAKDAIEEVPETNTSNYDHDHVCALATSVSNAFGILDTALNDVRKWKQFDEAN